MPEAERAALKGIERPSLVEPHKRAVSEALLKWTVTAAVLFEAFMGFIVYTMTPRCNSRKHAPPKKGPRPRSRCVFERAFPAGLPSRLANAE
jgi:hypothetical protein